MSLISLNFLGKEKGIFAFIIKHVQWLNRGTQVREYAGRGMLTAARKLKRVHTKTCVRVIKHVFTAARALGYRIRGYPTFARLMTYQL